MQTKQTEGFFRMRVQPSFLAKLDAWRREQDDLPNRSEAVRRLVEAGMKVGAEHAPA